MKKYAVIKDGIVDNIIAWDGEKEIVGYDSFIEIKEQICNLGYAYTEKTFSKIEEETEKIDMPPLNPLQFRSALRKLGLINSVKAVIETAPDEVKDSWEYSLQYNRFHPLIVSYGKIMKLSEEQIDEIFILGTTL